MAKSVNVTIPDLSKLEVQVSLEGQWVNMNRLATHMQQAVTDGYERGLDIFAKKLINIVRRSLTTGTPPPNSGTIWAPHAESTTARWGAHPIYNLTGNYANAVGVHTYRSRTLIGLPINIGKASKSGGKITINQLALTLEFGSPSRGIPARPVWHPSLESAGGRAELKKTLLKNIRQVLYQRTGIRSNQVRSQLW